MQSPAIIRLATSEDWEGIVHAHHEAIFGKASAHYSKEQMTAWADAMTRFTDDKSLSVEEKQSDVTVVAEREGKIVGFASAVPSQGLLKSVYVTPGNGPRLGERLLKEIEEQAIIKGVAELKGETSLNAVDFYRTHGYEIGEACTHALPCNREMPCFKMRKKLYRHD